MSLLSQVKKGKIQKPHLVLIHGAPGVGKSTFGADAPNPIFICGEEGTSHLDVARFPQPQSFQDVLNQISALTTDKHEYKTLVIDSLDWIEPLVLREVCTKNKVESIEDIGYGKGYVMAMDLWERLISALATLREKASMNVILICHTQIKSQYDAKEQKDYQRYILKLNEKASAKFREFVDAILFATYEVVTTTDDKTKKTKAYGGEKRIVLTQWRTSHDAKNRHGLPYQLPLSYEAYDDAVKLGQPEDPSILREEITALADKLNAQAKEAVLKKLQANLTAIDLMKLKNKVEEAASKAA